MFLKSLFLWLTLFSEKLSVDRSDWASCSWPGRHQICNLPQPVPGSRAECTWVGVGLEGLGWWCTAVGVPLREVGAVHWGTHHAPWWAAAPSLTNNQVSCSKNIFNIKQHSWYYHVKTDAKSNEKKPRKLAGPMLVHRLRRCPSNDST